MEISLAGVIVVFALVVAARPFGSPLAIAAIASFAFGATAIATVSAVGGASPLIYVVPNLALVAAVAFRRESRREIGLFLGRDPTAWLVILLAIYAVASAIIMPRLFAGFTSAFVNSRATGLAEVPLEPNSGNVTQAAYFALGALAFLAFGIITLQRAALRSVGRGFFAWAALTAFMGAIDLGGRLVGAGDVLAPIRTAAYAMITGEGATLGGFSRISGAHSEASAFAAAATASLAFAVGYWKRTGSRAALGLSVALLVLLILSTSTTAYVALAVLAACLGLSTLRSGLTRGFSTQDLTLGSALVVATAVVIAIALFNERILDPFVNLFEMTVINKGDTESARERGYWNARSLDAFLDTFGIGIGLGSSRSSNWIISVLSQLGLVGAALLLAIILRLAGNVPAVVSGADARALAGLHDGARNCALTILLAGTIAGGNADPGALFFIAVATVCACRFHLATETSRWRYDVHAHADSRQPLPAGAR